MRRLLLTVALLLCAGPAWGADFIIGDSVATGAGVSGSFDLNDISYATTLPASKRYAASAGDTVRVYRLHGERNSGGEDTVWCATFAYSAGVTTLVSGSEAVILVGATQGPYSSAAVAVGLAGGTTYVVVYGQGDDNFTTLSRWIDGDGSDIDSTTTFNSTWDDDGDDVRRAVVWAEGTSSGGAASSLTVGAATGGSAAVGGK